MNLFKRISAAVFAAALFCAGSALAVQPLEITDVFVEEGVILDGEIDPTTLFTITGTNFDNGGAIELTLGVIPLRILSQTDTVVEAALPSGMSSVEPGSYQMVATTGGGAVREDEFDGVTIGAVGKQGPKGDPGADGQDGTNGTNGQDGSDGQGGANCYDDIIGGTSVADCIGPEGPAGADGADGAPGADGIPGADGAPGAPGESGLTNLIATDSLVGTACDAFGNGGARVRFGLDTDRDGVLSEVEVQAVEYVCNGADGPQGEPGAPGASSGAAFEYILQTNAGFAISRDLRSELDEFCGDRDGCSIRIGTGYRVTNIPTGEILEWNSTIEEFMFQIGGNLEWDGQMFVPTATSYTVEGTEVELFFDVWVPSFSGKDGDQFPYPYINNERFHHCHFSDADPDSPNGKDLLDDSNGMTLFATADTVSSPGLVIDIVCSMYIFD